MIRNPFASVLYGSVAGVLIALGLLAFFGSMTAIDTIQAVPTEPQSVAAEAVFVATSTSFALLVLFAGAAGGLILTIGTYGVGRFAEPDAQRFSLAVVLPVGILLPAAMTWATMSLGATITGRTAAAGTIAVPALSMVVVAAIAGVVSGAATAPVVDALARPATVGPRNDATPVSSRAFWLDLMGAVGVPTLAIVTVAFLAIALSEVLLNAESMAVSVTVFSVVGALILGGTTLLALRPWERR